MLAKRTIVFSCFAAMTWMLFVSISGARTMYVTDSFEIMVRTGPSVEHKIIAVIKSNDEVDVLEEQDGWTKITLNDGSEGYVLTRFLTSETPNLFIMKTMQSKLVTLEREVKELREAKERLEASSGQLRSALSSREQELAGVKGEYEKWKKGANQYVKVKKRGDVLQSENSKLKMQLKNLEQQNAWLKRWKDSVVLASGAGVLLFGWLLGFVTGRIQIRRRRRMFYK